MFYLMTTKRFEGRVCVFHVGHIHLVFDEVMFVHSMARRSSWLILYLQKLNMGKALYEALNYPISLLYFISHLAP
jgi:hypothetical protein